MSKKDLTERDICTKFIVPALEKTGWDILRQVREELYFVSQPNGRASESHR